MTCGLIIIYSLGVRATAETLKAAGRHTNQVREKQEKLRMISRAAFRETWRALTCTRTIVQAHQALPMNHSCLLENQYSRVACAHRISSRQTLGTRCKQQGPCSALERRSVYSPGGMYAGAVVGSRLAREK